MLAEKNNEKRRKGEKVGKERKRKSKENLVACEVNPRILLSLPKSWPTLKNAQRKNTSSHENNAIRDNQMKWW